MKNLSVKVKLFLLSSLLTLSIIAAVIFAAISINSTEHEVTNVYYDKLYNVSSNLINADRDFYQAMIAATQYHEAVEGFVKLDAAAETKLLNDYLENRQQAMDNVEEAIAVARTDSHLYSGMKSEDGSTIESAHNDFTKDFNDWEAIYDVEHDNGDWDAFLSEFSATRASLSDMSDIAEAWAIEEHSALARENTIKILVSSIIFAIIIIALFIFTIVTLNGITGGLAKATNALNEVAGGNLTFPFPDESEMGNDEIGQIRKAAKRLSAKLSEIIGRTKEMSDEMTKAGTDLADSANQASQASSQVTDAVDEISKGAVSQAESVETSAHDASDIGVSVESINDVITELSGRASEMKATCDSAMEAMKQLLSQNASTVKSMKEIHTQIVATNNAVKDIADASQMITDISSQTNLLSLNASIEAARAGEAGRGFAVVASEIGSLADQSGSAAVKISEIVNNLVAESAKSVSTIEDLNERFEEQNKQLDSTNSDMETMAEGVAAVATQTNEISGQVASLNEAKESLVNIISDLSAISEENAAATEETNASMEELNATFTIISESAGQLQNLATELAESISYFKV